MLFIVSYTAFLSYQSAGRVSAFRQLVDFALSALYHLYLYLHLHLHLHPAVLSVRKCYVALLTELL